MLILGKKRRLALASQALAASLLIAIGASYPLPAHAQGGLPTLGDGSDLTSSEERRLGDRIIRELYRDPDYIDDPVIGEYVQGIWQPLMAAARARGELSPELDERFAWEVLLGRDRTVNAFALPGGYLGLHLGLIGVVGNVAQCACQLRGVVVLQHLAQIFGNFFFTAQVVGHIKWLGLAGRQISLQRPQGRWF